ncbi:hypothetical protein GWK47_045921 [Chionoecetes opilio]|uniref:Uncharacterized protein n=1 Tax=Chionoecetes opilio TaxID=41210 RepID=A0A8J5CWL4_CHIOP|nr:hypothetical protein GWK47_045921 [Chionoecetes opilio]
MSLGDPEAMLATDTDYEGLMERLRGQDDQYTQYSLEEVIYQLAKIIFKQAMHRGGDEGSERALQEVAALLEKEVARGVISPEVEKKLLAGQREPFFPPSTMDPRTVPSLHRLRLGYLGTTQMMNEAPNPCEHCLEVEESQLLHYVLHCPSTARLRLYRHTTYPREVETAASVLGTVPLNVLAEVVASYPLLLV